MNRFEKESGNEGKPSILQRVDRPFAAIYKESHPPDMTEHFLRYGRETLFAYKDGEKGRFAEELQAAKKSGSRELEAFLSGVLETDAGRNALYWWGRFAPFVLSDHGQRAPQFRDELAEMSNAEIKALSLEEKVAWLRATSMAHSATKQHRRLYKYMRLDPAFLAADQSRDAQFQEWLREDKMVGHALAVPWRPSALAQAVWAVRKKHAEIYDYPPPEIDFRTAAAGCAASFMDVGEKGVVMITLFSSPKDPRSSASILGSLVHELTHAYQAKLARDLRYGRMDVQDPRRLQAEIFALGLGPHYEMSRLWTSAYYRRQPIEMHAFEHEGKALSILKDRASNQRLDWFKSKFSFGQSRGGDIAPDRACEGTQKNTQKNDPSVRR